jgi:hypothetical protein
MVQIAANSSYDDLARVQANANFEHRRVRASDLVRVFFTASCIRSAA